MQRLLTALEIPEYYICVQQTHATGMEALMILLRRLVYPVRWCDLVPFLDGLGLSSVLYLTQYVYAIFRYFAIKDK